MLTKIPATNSNILNLKTIMPVTLQCSVMIAKNDEQVRKAARDGGACCDGTSLFLSFSLNFATGKVSR